MLTGILDGVTGKLEGRFLLNAFFPTVVFSIALMLAAAAGLDGVDGALASWDELGATVKVLLTVGWFAAAIVLANILATKTLGIVRLFEGYALPWGTRWTAKLARRRQHAKAERLSKKAQGDDAVAHRSADAFQQRYPVSPRPLTADHVAPTALGNRLRSAETYPMDRFGADSVRLWPRLYHLLPEELRASMDEARAAMELLLVVSFLASAYTLLASTWLLATGGPDAWMLGSLLGGSALACTAYWGSLAPASTYGDHVRTAFDLHRLELLEALRFPVPATADEERRAWALTTAFLDRGNPHMLRYVRASE